jgi:hypothetical protein
MYGLGGVRQGLVDVLGGEVGVLAEPVGEDAPVAPLFAAMASEIHYAAAIAGQASASGRLDPPLLMGLDEVTQICPVPLPAWLSDSGGKGIQVLAVVHGEAQLAGRRGDHVRQVVLDTSSVKAFRTASQVTTPDPVIIDPVAESERAAPDLGEPGPPVEPLRARCGRRRWVDLRGLVRRRRRQRAAHQTVSDPKPVPVAEHVEVLFRLRGRCR